jgi:glycosyltransferase involved in cell wall biosynthesis/ubiquinone/menaquinone biosynthesis C-methylase UbiE
MMTPEYEETVEFYKSLAVSPSGIPKDKIPAEAKTNMTDAELLAYYSELYVNVDLAKFPDEEYENRVNGLCNLVRFGEFFLDAGCANGMHMEVLYQKGIKGIGIDLSIPNILIGREKFPHLKFIHGFIEAIPFKDNYFDIVIMGDVIEHLRNPKASFAECLRVSRKGVALYFPITEEITTEHINPFNYEQIRELLDFYILDYHFFNFDGCEVFPSELTKSETYPGILIRAEKTAGTKTIIGNVLAAEGGEEHKRTIEEILRDDEWCYNTEHQRDKTHQQRFRLLSHLIEGQKVLEIGCGNGDLSIDLAKVGFEVTGIDISQEGINQASNLAEKENLTTKAEFMIMDATKLEFADNSIDTVIIPEVLEHFKDSRKILEEATRVVRNGGRIIVSVPDGLLVPFAGHLRVFFKDTLLTEFEQYAKEITHHELPFKKWLIFSFFVRKKELDITEGPAIDILMATYNGRQTIGKAIQSIKDQTYQNWKLIVINDGGEDIKDIIEGFEDSRIRYINTEHKGKSHALNVGIASTNSKFIGYLDDDDIIFPIHFEVLVNSALTQNKDFVYSDWYEISLDDNGKETGREFPFRQDVLPWMLITQNYINHKSILHSRSLLEKTGMYDENLDVLIDWDMIRRLAFVATPYHVWGVTSEHFLYYNRTIMQNRISSLWTRDPDKARKSTEIITQKTVNLVATTEDLKEAVIYSMLHQSYYHSLDHNNILKAKDSRIKDLEEDLSNMIQRTDELIKSLQSDDTQLSDLKTYANNEIERIDQLTNSLQVKDTHINTLEAVLAKKESQINLLQIHIQQSIALRLQAQYQKIIEKLFRPTTRRRHYYELGLAGIRVIMDEGWRKFLLKAKDRLKKKRSLPPKDYYANWIANNEPDSAKLKQQESISLNYKPKISIITPVFKPEIEWIKKAVESVISQTYVNWELCLVDGGSNNKDLRNILESYVSKYPNIKAKYLPENKGISGNSNEALLLATGEFIAFLDHDDELAPFALFETVSLLNRNPSLDIIYSDEDKIDIKGNRFDPYFKPDWSPDLLHSSMYTGHLSIYRRHLVLDLGGLRSTYDFSQDYDLALRATEKSSNIAHIPKILYHWRAAPSSAAAGAKGFARTSNIAALQSAVERRGYKAKAIVAQTPFYVNRILFDVIDQAMISIVVPTDDERNIISCIDSIIKKTSYPRFEIIVVTNSVLANNLLQHYCSEPKVRAIIFNKPFNFSAKCNLGASEAKGDFILFLNDDIEVMESNWLEEMLGYFQRPEVGAVGPKLVYPDNTIQDAGLITGVRGFIGTAFHGQQKDSFGYFGFIQSTRNVSALSAACLLMKRQLFLSIGKFDAVNTPIWHSDIDLCFRIRDSGYLLVYTPFVSLKHTSHVSVTKSGQLEQAWNADIYLLKRWPALLANDPYCTINMRRFLHDDFSFYNLVVNDKIALGQGRRNILLVTEHSAFDCRTTYRLGTYLIGKDNFVTVMTPSEGDMVTRCKEQGIPVIIDSSLSETPFPSAATIRLLKGFDLVVVSSINMWRVIFSAKQRGVPVICIVNKADNEKDVPKVTSEIRNALDEADMVLFSSIRIAALYKGIIRIDNTEVVSVKENSPLFEDTVWALISKRIISLGAK